MPSVLAVSWQNIRVVRAAEEALMNSDVSVACVCRTCWRSCSHHPPRVANGSKVPSTPSGIHGSRSMAAPLLKRWLSGFLSFSGEDRQSGCAPHGAAGASLFSRLVQCVAVLDKWRATLFTSLLGLTSSFLFFAEKLTLHVDRWSLSTWAGIWIDFHYKIQTKANGISYKSTNVEAARSKKARTLSSFFFSKCVSFR